MEFHGDEKFLLHFIGRDVVHAMGSVKDGRRVNVTAGLVREAFHLVAGVRFHRVDVPVRRVHVKAVIELQRRLIALHDPLGLRDLVVRRRGGGQAVEYAVGPLIVILQDDFVRVHVHRDRAIGRSQIGDGAQGRARSVGSELRGDSELLLGVGKNETCSSAGKTLLIAALASATLPSVALRSLLLLRGGHQS